MNKVLIALTFCLFIFLSSCRNPSPRHVILAHQHTTRYSKKLRKEGFFLYGYGGAMLGNIQVFDLSFNYLKKVDVEGARRLYIPLVEGMIDQVNADPEIQPFLNHSPATIDNFEISLGFHDEKGKRIVDGHIDLIYCVRQLVFYKIYDAENNRLITIHQEPYEVAKAIVMGECPPADPQSINLTMQ